MKHCYLLLIPFAGINLYFTNLKKAFLYYQEFLNGYANKAAPDVKPLSYTNVALQVQRSGSAFHRFTPVPHTDLCELICLQKISVK